MEVDENKPVVEESEKMDVIEKANADSAGIMKENGGAAGTKKENGDDAGNRKENGDGAEANGNQDKSLQEKIIRQIEYYFGDYNLPKDRFLKEQVLLDNGWVALDTMFKFARLSQLTKSAPVVIEALKKSTSGLMEVCEKTGRIRRSQEKPVPEETPERTLETKNRTVYCKGFPRDRMHIDTILEFFSKYPTVENAKMRYFTNKQDQSIFKGSVTATFSTREQAEKFMSLDVVKFNDYPLSRLWYVDWELEKTAEYEARKAKKAGKPSNQGESNGTNNNDRPESDSKKIVLPRGTLLKLSGIPDGTNRDKIKEALASTSAEVCFVDFLPDHVALVRLRNENEAKSVLEKLDNGKVTIGDASVEASVLEGEEEETALKKAEDHMNSSSSSQGSRGGRGGGRGRGRGRGRGGRGGGGRGRGGRGGYKGKRRGHDAQDGGDSGDDSGPDSGPSAKSTTSTAASVKQEPSATSETASVKQEPSAATGEKRQGSPESGNPAKKARDE